MGTGGNGDMGSFFTKGDCKFFPIDGAAPGFLGIFIIGGGETGDSTGFVP
jgi:hypothetical protein